MGRNLQDVVAQQGKDAQPGVNGTGGVLPVPFSHPSNVVGVHWLRISFAKKHLADISQLCSYVWGDFELDGFGLWSYDSRHYWSSGVSLNYDQDDERSARVHCGMMTLDCPGSALDEMTAPDLQLIIEAAQVFGAGWFKRVWRVTLPLLRPSIQTALILRTLSAVGVFAVVHALAGRGMTVLAAEAYRWYGEYRNPHMAAIFAMFILSISLITAFIYLRALRVKEEMIL